MDLPRGWIPPKRPKSCAGTMDRRGRRSSVRGVGTARDATVALPADVAHRRPKVAKRSGRQPTRTCHGTGPDIQHRPPSANASGSGVPVRKCPYPGSLARAHALTRTHAREPEGCWAAPARGSLAGVVHNPAQRTPPELRARAHLRHSDRRVHQHPRWPQRRSEVSTHPGR